MPEPLEIGLLGFGNIGCGVVQALHDNRALLDARCPRPLHLRWVADIDLDRPRPVEVDRGLLTRDAKQVLLDPAVDVVIELIGGIEPARTFVELALREGKHVVTANKALLAQHGAELLALAARQNVRLLFEASVGGGVPVIRVLTECLAANRITRIEGILNGTCNFILTQMSENELSFEEALAEAQRLGYAEADPTADVESIDAANKIAILASLAFGCNIRLDNVRREGITRLTAHDLRAAEARGYVIRQRAVAERLDSGLGVSVRPSLLSKDHALASVSGVLNGIAIEGEPIGTILLVGPGAGPRATASAVLSDVIWLSALDPEAPAPPPFLTIPDTPVKETGGDGVCSGYWLRLLARDRLNAPANVARVLADHRIPIRSLDETHWLAGDAGAECAVEVFVGQCLERDLQAAVAKICAAQWAAPDDPVLILPRLD
ncbi:MAG: homoserine dehydrogenase [Candidatus Sumerlaeia bacterium]|nr:homoserine dehydrogenase [Candidatus Sumerlaeia bacterium]